MPSSFQWYWEKAGEGAFTLSGFGESYCHGLFSTELSRNLFQSHPWQCRGITSNLEWTSGCSKGTPMVFRDLFPQAQDRACFVHSGRQWAFCQGSWGIFASLSSLVSWEKERERERERMMLLSIIPKVPFQWFIWHSTVSFNKGFY